MNLNESYVEQLVQCQSHGAAGARRIVSVIMCVLAVLCILFFWLPGLALGAVLGAGAYVLFITASVEYEYLFVSGELTVDKILARSRRKQVFQCSMGEVIAIAPVNAAPNGKHVAGRGEKTLDFTSRDSSKRIFCLTCQKGTERIRVMLEPNEALVQCFQRAAPMKMTL